MRACITLFLFLPALALASANFDIPTEYPSLPATFIEELDISDPGKVLDNKAKEELACLLIHAELTSQEKYHQTFTVSASSPSIILFLNNFPEFTIEKWEGKNNKGDGVIFLSQIHKFLIGRVSC